MLLRWSFLLLVPFLLLGCAKATGDPDCAVPCAAGEACIEGQCVQLCNSADECEPYEDCLRGACVSVNATCYSASDCANPADLCLDAATGQCVAGQCQYDPIPLNCTSPPANQCNSSDDQWLVYDSFARCQEGKCTYDIADSVACPDCSTNCVACDQSNPCPANNGECRNNGRCEQGTYSMCTWDTVDNGTSCTMADSRDGYCFDGVCVECFVSAHCQQPPGPPVCVANTACTNRQCVYTGDEAAICQPAGCVDGVVYTADIYCTADALCPQGTTTSCNGYACASDGQTCKTSCAGDTDCLASFYCDGSNTCQSRAGLPDVGNSIISFDPSDPVANGTDAAQIIVTVRDILGTPVTGIDVTLAADGSNNFLTQPASSTGIDGTTSGTLTSTRAEQKTVTVTSPTELVGLEGNVAFRAGSAFPLNSSISVAPSTVEVGGGQGTVTITMRDSNDNPVPGITTTFAATGSGNTLIQPSATTDENGEAEGYISSTAMETKTVSIATPAGFESAMATVQFAQVAVLGFVDGTDDPLDFGYRSTNVTHTFTLENSGGTYGTEITIEIVNTGSPQYWPIRDDLCTGIILDAGQTCTFEITFAASTDGMTAGVHTATVRASATVGGTAENGLIGTAAYSWVEASRATVSTSELSCVDPVPSGSCSIRGQQKRVLLVSTPSGVQFNRMHNPSEDALCEEEMWGFRIPSGGSLVRPCGGGTQYNASWSMQDLCCYPEGTAEPVWSDNFGNCNMGACASEYKAICQIYDCR